MASTSWVLVAGAGKDPLPPELAQTASVLGRALAEAGLSLVTNGWPGVDHAVGTAFVEALRARSVEPSARFRQYRTRGLPVSVPGAQLCEVEQDAAEYLHAVDAADVIVVIAGANGTPLVDRHARNVGKPVLPLPRPGGSAATIFEELRGSFDRDRYLGIPRHELDALDQPAPQAVAAAIRFIRQYLDARAIRDGEYLTPGSVVGRDNEAAIERLAEELREGMMAFIGAGTSIPGGYPDWRTLIERMQSSLLDQDSRAMAYVSREDDLLMRAERYRQLMGEGEFGRFVREQFGPERGTCRELHHDLVRLPFTHVLTTNYDNLLERAHASAFPGELPTTVDWQNNADIEAFLRAARRRGQPRRYVHLHGVYNDPSSIVLSESDYQRRYHESASGEMLLSVLFTAHPFLFIGFSFTDMDMMGVFRGTMARLRLQGALHFAFVALDPRKHDPTLVRQRLRRKYKIEPVFYVETPDHAGLHDLVKRLAARG
ncbi:SIR2 family protein [Paraliomyxa miuraensis]|uniref:SIR2 family protein n=1 Tax=Paraliomyxa miuraensis TaxID=376150 RepID=UPI00225B3893|nr:SIR2 family protein [Paraliomyxa miuraensis]MCX4244103.1 SIR2 family protein [Paraliomyxa miuraensis]